MKTVQITPTVEGASCAPSHGYPLRSLEEFAQWLIKHGLLDECAYYDSDGFDGGRSLARLSNALRDAAGDNNKLRDAAQ